ncbi:hypothetical protein DYB26_008921 [Aphanomyces astaci]|uniref:Arp2/3 complex 34 kDa subunit n=1 Tax=Aphanomyces astaci TaxID=112090 RepID=A0A397B9L3_APHAT|nr:hypothetical protein DYB36_006860 [Aphanomyces astaci]RHZ09795.1 hypothetical protein DYB26_008921 [Aphanomyces astaci]
MDRFGAANMLAKVYPEFQITTPKPGFELTLVANVDTISPQDAAKVLSPIQIPFRRQETIYVLPQEDRIVIVFSVAFQDRTDQAIARVFLQEFAEARRHVNNAPPVSFGKDPPLELRAASGLHTSPDHVGYLSFGTSSLACIVVYLKGIVAIFKSHIDSEAKRENACTLLQGFRNYLHYHIKASKTYLHIRMRKRVDLLLQDVVHVVLNRAQPAKDPAKTSKKTITGKTFDRKV